MVSISAANKTYDATTAATITTGSINGTVGTETLTVSGIGTFSDKNAANNKTVTVADVTTLSKINGTGDWANYNLTSTGAKTTTASISRKNLTALATANDKVYNGSATATVVGSSSELIGSDSVSFAYSSAVFSDKNVSRDGSGNVINKAVTVSGLTLTGTDAGNYALQNTAASSSAKITPAALNVSATANNKTYDGSRSATAATSASNAMAGDTVVVSNTGALFDTKQAGTGKTVTVAGLALSGSDSGNYALQSTTATTTANIDKKAITLTGITAANKTYDGGTAATVSSSSASFNDKVAGDDLSVASTGLFIDKNAATGKTVNLTHTLGGADIGNYSVTAQPTTTADIARKNLTAVATANDKVYDGSTTATAVGSSSDIIGADSVGFAYSGAAFSDKNVSRNGSGNVVNKTVTVSGLSLTGTDAGNYALQNPTASTVAQITPAALTVTAIESNKIYDGNFNAVGTATVGSLATANDSVNTAATQTYLDQNAGTLKTVRASGLTLKDASNADMTDNYTITYVDNTTSSIAKANLTVAANSDARFVVQTDAAGYNGVSYSGFVAGETSSVLGGSVSISRSNAATQAAGHYSGALVASGLTAANYNISYANGDYTIVAANQLLVRTTNTTATYGSTPTYSTTAQYLDGSSNQIASLTRTGSGNNYTFSDGAGGSISMLLKPYTGSSVGTASSSGNTIVGNYDIKDANPTVVGSNFVGNPVFVGALTVNSKAVTPTVDGVGKVYDGSTAMNNLVLGMDGKVTGDSLSISGTGAFNQKNAGQNLGYTVSGISLNGGDASNYYLSMVGSGIAGTNGSITPAALVLTSADVSKVYDRSTSANGVAKATQSTQLFGSDSLTGGTFAFTDKNVGSGNKTVTTSGVTINDGNNGANYTVSYVDNTTSSITAKNLTVSYSAASKTYDGSRTATVTASSADLISGDTVSFNHSSALFDNKQAQAGKTVSVAGIELSGSDAGNYALQSTTATTTSNIDKKVITLTGITAANKTYDGGTAATVSTSSASFNDKVAGDELTVASTGSFSDKNAAAGKTVNLTNTLGGADLGNYTITHQTSTTANIAKKDVTLASITAAGKTYDGNDTASITAGSISTGVGSETLAVSGSGTFSDKNAATGKTVTVADVTALTKTNGTGDWSNYNLTSTGSATTTANIAKKDVTLASITAAGKTYDGNDTASITAGSISTGVGSETLAVSGSGTFSDKNAATGKTVTVADVTALTKTNGTGDWSNYNLTSTGSATTTADIAKKDVTLASITAAGKTYDGNDTASITAGSISTGVGSETLAVSGSGTFSDKNAATGKTVTVADVTALTKTNGTGDWSNYNLTSTGSATTTANIAKKDVTLVSITAAGKTYDGSNTASITSGAISTGVGSETLAVSGSGTFSDKNAATGKTVTVADVTALTKTNGTGDWNNYNLTSTGSATTTADIDKKTITLTGITAANKTYDGGTAATVSTSSASFNDKVAGDDLSVVSTGSFSDKNAATNKTVSLTHTLGGADIGNYSVTAQDTTTANIDKKAITLSGITAANKTYDGGTAATVSTSSASFNDKVAGDDLSVASTGLFIDKNAATGKTVNLTHTLGGADIGNYSVTAQPTTTADIARKNLTAVATANDKVYDGSTTATAVGSSSDIIGADSVGFAYSGAAFSDKNVSRNGSGNVVNKTVTVSGLSLTGTDAGNYALQNPTASTVAQITPAALTVTAIESNKIYDGNFNAVGTATVGSLATANDSVNTAATQTYLDQNAGTLKTVRASGLTLKDASNADMTDNYTITYVDNATSSIAKANLTVAANSDARFVVQTDAAGYNGVSYSGFVAGETSSVLGGSVSISRSDAATNVAAGHYSGALVASGLTAANYNISYANGDYTIVAANQLLVRTTNTTTTYGSTPTYTTTAQYLDGSSNQIASLTPTVSGNNYTFSDGVGGSISMQLKPYTGSSVATTSISGNTNVGSYDIKDTSPTVVGSNFVGSPVFVGALTVNSKAVSPTVTGGVSKVYDGSTTMNNLVLGMDGKVTGDSLSISGTGAFNQKNVGQNLGYTISGISLNGGDASNYYLSMVGSGIAGTNGSITPAALVLTSADVSKVYDRSTSANGVAKATQSTQLFGSDSLTGGTFAFTDKNVGSGNKTVTTSGVTINDGNNGTNYTVSYVDNTTSSITAKNLTVSYSAASKTYDGSRTATVTASSADLISGDTVSFNNSSANFSDKNVDTNKTVTVTGLSINGNDAGNYNLTNTSATTTAAISQARLQEVNAAKTYDGQSTVTGNQLTLIKGVGNETFTAAATDTASITGKDVTTANNKVTSTSGLNLTGTAEGTLASNYDLTATPVASAVTIAQKEVVLSAAKTYDGNKNLSAAQLSITTGVGSETLSSSGATINSKNVADNSTNFVDAVTLVDGSGVNAGLASNYKAPTLTVRDGDKNTVSISKATLALTLANQTKVYDGTDTAAIKAGDVTATGVTVGSNTESASFKAVTGAYNSKNVASANATSATVSSTNVDTTAHGLDLNNYTLSTTGVTQTASNNTSAISKATLALALADQTKVYDGTVTASIKAGDVTATGVTVGTSTESISFKAVTGAFNSKNVASASSSSATVSSTSVDTATAAHGMDLSNYTLSTTGVTQIASNNASTISKANLNVAAQTVTKVYDGTTAATGTGTVGTLAGQAAGESVNSAGTQTFTDKNFGMGNKTVKASGVTIKDGSGADVTGNYNVAYSDNTASTINKADLSVTAQAVTKVYDGTTAATGTGTVGALAGQAAGESVNSAGTQTFTDKNFGVGNKTVKASGVSIKDSSGADVTGNYNVAYTDNTASTINKAKLTVTLADQSKTYDGTTAATLVPSAFTVKGVTVAGQTETASVNQTAALYNDKNVLGASSVTAILVAGNFAGATGTDLNNYILPTSVTANGSITPKVAAVTGTATTMQANGTLQTQLPATKSGFVAGEDVTVSGLATGMIAGTYNSNLSAAPANAATVLSNYNMAYTNATLKITPAIVTNSTVAVALARTPTPSSRLNLLGFSNTSAQGAAVAGNVYSGDDSKGLPSAKGLSPQTCSPENLQQCECQEGGDNGIEMCTSTDSKF